jgi:hypothetical protein
MTEEALFSVYLKLLNPPKFYKENQPFEWNWRTVSRKPIDLDGLSENLNVITQVNRRQGEIKVGNEFIPFDRGMFSFDINTAGKNNDHRFDLRHIVSFYRQVVELHDLLSKEVTGLINE